MHKQIKSRNKGMVVLPSRTEKSMELIEKQRVFIKDLCEFCSKSVCKPIRQEYEEGRAELFTLAQLEKKLYLVVEGVVGMHITGPLGNTLGLAVKKSGELINPEYFEGVGEDGERTFIFYEKSVLLPIDWSVVRSFFSKNPEYYLFFMSHILVSVLRQRDDLFTVFTRADARQRIHYVLGEFASAFSDLPALPLSRREIANFAGTTEETMSRIITILEKEKLLSCDEHRKVLVNTLRWG